MFLEQVYSVFLDGNFVGICINEDECWEVAQNHINGIDVLLDDDVDRVMWHKINVNKWYYYDEYNCSNNISDENIMCYDYHETKDCVQTLNRIELERERAEAKLRAMAL